MSVTGRGGDAAIDFQVLGPLEAWRGETALRLGGERQRGLLALLLVSANQLVTTESLAELLFAGGDDGAATNAVRVAVSRLRRLLDDGADDGTLVTRPGGYVLVTAAEHLDCLRFEALLEEGQRRLGADEPLAAAATLREALGLWRGPPFADLSTLDYLQPEIRRLAQLRALAVIERIAADLALGHGAGLISELEQLVAAHPLQERLRGQLMLALYRAGRQADALAAYRETTTFLRDELGLDPSPGLAQLEQRILHHDRSLDGVAQVQTAAGPRTEMVCPFKGLGAFDRIDAEFFCGREREVTDLVTRCAASSLVGIIGASGAGKSSTLRAGVLAALAAGALPGSERWAQFLLRPGPDPCGQLARALDGPDVAAALKRLGTGDRIVIAVDQLEELFTVCRSHEQRAAFLDELVAAARDHGRRALVLVSLRADFYGRCAEFPPFADWLSQDHVLVGPMDRDQLMRAIELPANRAGLNIEAALLEELVAEVAGEPGGLPLLSTTLLELWRAREDRVLRYESYRRLGGVRGAVARLAEDAYMRLTEVDRQVARKLMLRLAGGDIGTLVRRRVPVGELGEGQRVLASLVDARLLTISGGSVEVSHEALLREWPRFLGWIEEDRAGRRVHEHLAVSAGAWDARHRDPADLHRGARLNATLEWVAEHPGELSTVEREFVEASRAHAERQLRRERYQNRRLRILLAVVGALLLVAVAAGIVALADQHAASAEARAALARQLGSEALVEPRIDRAMLLARESVDLDRSRQTEGTLLATLLRSPAAIATFTLPIDARPQGLTLAPDGRSIAVSDNIGNIRFYDARTHAARRSPLGGRTGTAPPVYSIDGSLMLSAASIRSPYVDVRDARTLARVAALRYDRRRLTQATFDLPDGGLAISPDRRDVYYVYGSQKPDGRPGPAYLDRWRLPGGRRLSSTPVGSPGLMGMRLLDGGRRLVVVTNTQVRRLDARSLRVLSSVGISGASGDDLATVNGAGSRAILSSQRSGSVSFVDLSSGRAKRGIGGHEAGVRGSAFSPDGRVAVTVADDRRVIVWDPVAARPLQVLDGHAGRVLGIAFSADGQSLYTCSLDGVVLEWDLGRDRRFGRPFTIPSGQPAQGSPDTPPTPPLAVSPDGSTFAVRAHGGKVALFSTTTLKRTASFTIGRRAGAVTALAWAPRAQELAVAGHDGAVQLWSVGAGARRVRAFVGLRSLTGLPEAVQAVAFDPSGQLLAASDINHTPGTGPPDGHLGIWHTASGSPVSAPRDLHDAGVALAFSPDARQLATGLADGRVLLIDPASIRIRRELRPLGDQNVAVAFAPDGTLATGSWAGIVQRWAPLTGRPLRHPVLVGAAPVSSIAFDRSGTRFATTGGSDGTAKLWDAATLQQQGTTLDNQPGTWGNAAFTPEADSLITIHDNGRGTLWPVDPQAWKRHACTVAGRNLTPEEWSRFVTGNRYAIVCPRLPPAG